MICGKCGARVNVIQTFAAGAGGKTQAAVCEGCGKPYTLVTFALEVEGRGSGAKGVAAAIRNGEVIPRMLPVQIPNTSF